MYKTIIVDDNRMATDSLSKTIPWSELGLELAGVSYNGKQACEMIRKLSPDIVVSDIHMPEMDGLEMMELMCEELQSSKVIFITAYEKIEYASKAIKLSAFDFILKPLDDAELYKSLQRAVSALDKERSEQARHNAAVSIARRARFISALNLSIPLLDPASALSFMNSIPKSYFVAVIQSNKDSINNPILQRLELIDFPAEVEIVSALSEGNLVLLCSILDPALNWQLTAGMVSDILTSHLVDIVISISSEHKNIQELHKAYDEALYTQLQHNLYGKHSTVDYFEPQDHSLSRRAYLTELEQSCSHLAAHVDSFSPDEIWNKVLTLSKGNLRMLKITLMFFCTKIIQEKMSRSNWSNSTDITVYDLPKLSDEKSAKSWLDRFMLDVKQNSLPSKKNLVNDVLEYIKTNVTERLAMEDVASKFFISPNYLSALIRKETGETYRQHVINAKIALAKQMLGDSRIRMDDIAYAIGYENYISFYNAFKKNVGMSPTEYRFSGDQEQG